MKIFNIREELKNYRPYDERERKDLERIIKFLQTDENCFERSNLKGHMTAGAFVADRYGNILLNHHKKADMWFQFGGHADGDEDSLNVAKREVFEEAGITEFENGTNSIFDVQIETVPANHKKGEPEHFHYDINFLFIVDDKSFKVSDESDEIKWVTIDEAKKLISPDDYGMLRMIKKYEKYLENLRK